MTRGHLLATVAFCTLSCGVARSQSAGAEPTAPPDLTANNEIIVSGYRASLETAREQKRQSEAIIDAIAAEDISQFPDNSATEALNRLPGVTTQETRGERQSVTVRGLSQVLTTVNGMEDYTGISRQTLLNSYPAALIASAQIAKALTPDMVEGGIAGAVNIDFRKPLDLKTGTTVAIQMRGTYDGQTKSGYYNGDVLLGRKWQSAIGEIGVLIDASYLRRDYSEYYRQNQTPQASTAAATRGDILPGGILIRHQPGGFQRPAITGAIQWKPNPDLSFDVRATHITDHNQRYDTYLTTSIAANTPLSDVQLIPGTNIIKSATFLSTGSTGPYASNAEIDYETTMVEFGGRWDTGIATLTSRGKYTTTHSTNDTRAVLFGFKTVPTINAQFASDAQYGGLAYQYVGVDMHNPANFYLRSYSDSSTDAKADGFQWRTDLELDLGSGLLRALKLGVRYTNRSIDYNAGSRSASLSATSKGTTITTMPGGDQLIDVVGGFYGDNADIPRSWVGYDTRRLGGSANQAALAKYFYAATGSSVWSTDAPVWADISHYTGTENTYALYGQLRFGAELGGVPIDGIAGVRVVGTNLDLNGTQQTTSKSGAVSYAPINGRQDYLNVDPAVLLRAHFTRTLQLRLAYSKTFTRPDFSQLNPNLTLSTASSTTTSLGTASAGNPGLTPTKSVNYDVSLEWYFGKTGSASLALFRRDIDGLIVNTVLSENVPSAGGLVDVTRPVNAGKGYVKGAEFALNTFFEFLPGLLHNFGVGGAFTYLKSFENLPQTAASVAQTGPIPVASKYSGTASVFYDDHTFRIRAGYTYRSKYLLAYNTRNFAYNQWWDPMKQLDISANYKIARQISVGVDATNVLHNHQTGYLGTPLIQDRIYYVARTISGSLRLAF
ncbi:TonB-dependent receptor [Sphingomonas sp. MMS24-J13]|uniref:TonB-dependent receptor n=1 Tax=Sphingomonas sp. MMS24-J13 TaxID=3238686 RepID=UPI00384EA8EF